MHFWESNYGHLFCKPILCHCATGVKFGELRPLLLLPKRTLEATFYFYFLQIFTLTLKIIIYSYLQQGPHLGLEQCVTHDITKDGTTVVHSEKISLLLTIAIETIHGRQI